MLDTLISSLPSIILVLAATVAGLLVFRQVYIKNLGEMQEKLIAVQDRQIKQLKLENAAMRAAFKHMGIEIEIDGSEIILIDGQKPKRTRIMSVKIDDEEDSKDGKTP